MLVVKINYKNGDFPLKYSQSILKTKFNRIIKRKDMLDINLKKCHPVADPVTGHNPKKITRSLKFWVVTQKYDPVTLFLGHDPCSGHRHGSITHNTNIDQTKKYTNLSVEEKTDVINKEIATLPEKLPKNIIDNHWNDLLELTSYRQKKKTIEY